MSVNLSTCRVTPTQETKLEAILRKMGFEKAAHYWRRNVVTLIQQTEAGEEIDLPLRYATKPKPTEQKTAAKTKQNLSRHRS